MDKKLRQASYVNDSFPDLHKDKEVEAVVAYLRQYENIPNEPLAKIGSYVAFLSDYVNDGVFSGDRESVARQASAAAIKPDDIPESYYALQERIARERGTPVTLRDAEKLELANVLRVDQTASLISWLGYVSNRSPAYPDWFKYTVFENIKKMGSFNAEKGIFPRRGKGTTANFPELDKEALSVTYDALLKAKKITPNTFMDMYSKHFSEQKAGRIDTNELDGEWIRYEMLDQPYVQQLSTVDGVTVDLNEGLIDHPTVLELVSSLEGKGTGWCTVGPSTAALQLSSGDMHIYYAYDSEGQPTIPKVAIRTEYDQVIEVRGVKPQQELDEELFALTSEKLKSIKGGETYFDRIELLKKITAIESKHNAGEDLTVEELFVLYEVVDIVMACGYNEYEEDAQDPRTDMITHERDFRADFIKMFGREPDNEAALDLIEMGYSGFVFQKISKFHDLTFAVAKALITKESLEGVKKSSVYYSNTDDESLVAEIVYSVAGYMSGEIDDELAYSIERKLKSQGQMDKYTLRRIENIVANCHGKNAEKLGLFLLENYDTWQIADNIEKFSNISISILIKLLDKGEEEAVMNNRSNFSAEARRALNRYIKDDGYNFLEYR